MKKTYAEVEYQFHEMLMDVRTKWKLLRRETKANKDKNELNKGFQRKKGKQQYYNIHKDIQNGNREKQGTTLRKSKG